MPLGEQGREGDVPLGSSYDDLVFAGCEAARALVEEVNAVLNWNAYCRVDLSRMFPAL